MSKIRTLIKEIKKSQKLDIWIGLPPKSIGITKRYIENYNFYKLEERYQKRIIGMCQKRQKYFEHKYRKRLAFNTEAKKIMIQVCDRLFGIDEPIDIFNIISGRRSLRTQMIHVFDMLI